MQDRLVTLIGGGGFLGRYVAQELLKASLRLRIAERNPDDAWFLKPLGNLGQIQYMPTDITKPNSLPRAVEGADAVVNFVGLLKGDFETVHVKGAANAAQAARDAGVQDFIQISSVGAALNADSHYLRSKAGGEAAVRAAMPGAIIIRPSVIFGEEDGFINRFASLARMAPMMVPVMRAEAKFQPAYVVDCAKAIARAVIDPASYRGETFELGGPQVLSMGEINRYILDVIGKPDKPIFEVPDFVGAIVARFGFMPFAPITWDQWQSLQSDNVCATDSKGFESFDITPCPLGTVAECWLVQYRTHGRFAGKVTSEA